MNDVERRLWAMLLESETRMHLASKNEDLALYHEINLDLRKRLQTEFKVNHDMMNGIERHEFKELMQEKRKSSDPENSDNVVYLLSTTKRSQNE